MKPLQACRGLVTSLTNEKSFYKSVHMFNITLKGLQMQVINNHMESAHMYKLSVTD